MHPLAALDRDFVWHPFTQMQDWVRCEPIVIAKGQGAVLQDVRGRRYLDANSSMWTNLNGHNHSRINATLKRQLKKISHSTALGLANEPASVLAQKLVAVANPRTQHTSRSTLHSLSKVFFSDNGSSAIEVALKLAWQFALRTGCNKNPKFLSLESAYHGDTLGAAALGHIGLFQSDYRRLLFKSDKVMTPYCYRCPYNRAHPERADAREYRKCNWECVDKFESKFVTQKKKGNGYSGFVFEPLIQGAAGMIAHPAGWLRRVAEIARGFGAQLIADEVMTGFGRTSKPEARRTHHKLEAYPTLFACQNEGVQPDFLALAKGMTGGYLPMAATLTTQPVFDAFLGNYSEFKTFFHGHSYTANQLGAAAALANLEVLQTQSSIRARRRLERNLSEELKSLWSLPNVGDVRQVGLIAGIELVKNWRTREPFDLREKAGIRVCEAMARRGVLTRPIGNVVVLMPPYCTTAAQVREMVGALAESIRRALGSC